jgi:UTP:GlnB (protein PII) uridylyltransferase
MSDVKALENAVKALPPQDLAEFREWFAEFDLAAWDAKIESDLASGKLDELLAEAKEDYSSGERKFP